MLLYHGHDLEPHARSFFGLCQHSFVGGGQPLGQFRRKPARQLLELIVAGLFFMHA